MFAVELSSEKRREPPHVRAKTRTTFDGRDFRKRPCVSAGGESGLGGPLGAGWLVEADLRGADLSDANLKRANLRGANLERANMHSANLTGANLEGANLFRVKANVANLNMANLRGANLKEANLVSANLVRADLEEADLEKRRPRRGKPGGKQADKGARITNVNLKMANLDGADLTEAVLEGISGLGTPADAENGDFHGTITAIRLADLLQIGCLSRSNLNIEVYSTDGQGNIYIGSGRVLHAHTDGIEGEEAFMKILGWEKGRPLSPILSPYPVRSRSTSRWNISCCSGCGSRTKESSPAGTRA